MKNAPIGIFDSGSGGLTTLDSCRSLLPNENYIYVSDARPDGWGGLTEANIARRASECVDKLLSCGCKAVVAACNTATEVGIGLLRDYYSVPFVGLEPALKPAVRAFPDGKILVLCTPATARQTKFKELLSCCDNAHIKVRPQPELAKKIEKNLYDLDVLLPEVEHIIEADKPDAIVLGCTHYVFLRHMFERIAGADKVFDGNGGAARRLKSILAERGLLCDRKNAGAVEFHKI